MQLRETSNYKGWLYGLAFLALITFSIVSLGTNWHWHGSNFISVKTDSFTPLLVPGDAVVTQPATISELSLGDKVGYRNPLNAAETRIGQVQGIDSKNKTVTFDWNGNASVKDVSDSLLIGRVDYRLSHVGYLLDFVHSRWGLVIAVYLPSLLIVGQEVRILAGKYTGYFVYRLHGYSHTAPLKLYS